MKQATVQDRRWKFDTNRVVEGLLEVTSDCCWTKLVVCGDLDPLECVLVHLLSLGGQEDIKNRDEGICLFIKDHTNEAPVKRLGNDTKGSIDEDF